MSARYRKGPDGGWGWLVVLGSFLIHFIIDGVLYTSGLFLSHFLAEFKSGETLTSMTIQMLCGISLMIGPLAGALINAWGCRLVGIVGALVAAAGLILTSFAGNIYVVLLTFGVITGAGLGLLYVSSVVIISIYFTSKLARASGIATSGSGLGTILFAPLIDALLQNFSWRTTMACLAVTVFLSIPCAWLFRPLMLKRTKPRADGALLMKHVAKMNSFPVAVPMDSDEAGSSDTLNSSLSDRLMRSEQQADNLTDSEQIKKSDSPSQVHETEAVTTCEVLKESFTEMLGPEVLQDYNFIVFTCAAFLISLGYLVPYVYSKNRALELGLGTDSESSYLISIVGLGSTVGRLLFGYLSDFTCINRLVIYLVMAIISGVLTMVSVLLRSYLSFAIYLLIFGLLSGGDIALTSVVITDLFQIHRVSNVFGLLSLFEGIACTIPITGWIYERTGSLEGSFLVAGACYVAGGLILLLIPLRGWLERHIKRDNVLQDDLEQVQANSVADKPQNNSQINLTNVNNGISTNANNQFSQAQQSVDVFKRQLSKEKEN